MCTNSVTVQFLKFSWDTSELTSGGGSLYRSINGVYGSWLSLNGCVLFLAASSDYGFQMCKCCLFLNLGMECSWWHWDKQVFQWLAGYLLSSILCIILLKQSSLFTYYPLIRFSLSLFKGYWSSVFLYIMLNYVCTLNISSSLSHVGCVDCLVS